MTVGRILLLARISVFSVGSRRRGGGVLQSTNRCRLHRHISLVIIIIVLNVLITPTSMVFFGFCGFHAKRSCFYFIAYFPHRILYAGHGFSNLIRLAYIGFSSFYFSQTYLRCNDPHCNNNIMVYYIPYHLCWRPTVFLCFLAAGCPIICFIFSTGALMTNVRQD